MTPRSFADVEALNAALDHFLRPGPPIHQTGMEVFARRTARFLALSEPPRPAAPVLRSLGIEVVREGLPGGLCAVWTIEGGRYRVRLSPFLSGPRADFTLWHEWFEMMAARPAFSAVCEVPPQGRPREHMAGRFAACLMMPSDAVIRAAENVLGGSLHGRGDKTAVLAARFGVSTSAMRLRLRDLQLDRRETPFW